MKRKFTLLAAALMLLSCLAVPLGMWGQTRTTTYKLTAVTSVSAGNKYVFEQSGCVMSNSVSNNKLQTTTTYNTTGLSGNESYVWTLETATNGFYMKNVSLQSNSYLKSKSKSTDLSFSSTDDYGIWSFTFSNGVCTIAAVNNSSRFLGFVSSSDHTYKAYASNNSNAHAITVYLLEEESTDPLITVSPTSLTGMTYSQGDGPSTAKTFTLNGSNLTNNIVVSLGNNSDFEMSMDGNNYQTDDFELSKGDGTVSNRTLYVRLALGKGVNTYESTVSITSIGATAKSVSLSGSVTGYTVTYNCNDATSGCPENATNVPLGNYTLASAPSKDHYTFVGWKDGTTTYNAGASYTINGDVTFTAQWIPTTHTFTTSATNGTIEAKDSDNNTVSSGSNVAETAQITLTAIPAEGYNFTSWSVEGTGSTLTSTDTNPTTFTMGTANSTVTAAFVARTPATVTLHHGNGGSTTTVVNTYIDATVGDLGVPAIVNGWTTMGWVLSYTSGYPELVSSSTSIDAIDNDNHELNLYAAYTKGSNTFQLITSTDDLEVDGTYMIGGSKNSKYFLMDAAGTNVMNCTSEGITLSNNTFEYSNGKKFVLGGTTGSYTFYDGSSYLETESGTSSTVLKLSESLGDYGKWGISFNSGKVQITKYNASRYVSWYSSQSYFNCYTNENYIYLFKQITNDLQYSITPVADKCTVTYNANGGTGDAPIDNTQYTVGATVTVAAGTGLSMTGYSFNGWNTKADGTGTTHAAGTTFAIYENTTLYAQWMLNTHNVTLPANDAYGNYTMNVENPVAYNTEVTLTFTPASGNYNVTWYVNNSAIQGNTFTMPDENVIVTVTLEENPFETVVLSSSDMQNMSNAGESYGTTKAITINGLTWETNGRQACPAQSTTPYGMIQLRKRNNGVSDQDPTWIKLPDFSGKIETITLSVTDAGNTVASPSDGGGKCKAIMCFQGTDAADANIVAEGGNSSTGTNEITLDLTPSFYTTGYITIKDGSNAGRVWNISVVYRPYKDMTGTTLTSIEADRAIAIPANTAVTATDLTIPASSGILIKSGASLTVSGTLTNGGNANSLIIEDGGQLITGVWVNATVKKNITAYTSADDGWNLISSPVNTNLTAAGIGLTTETTYDLYYLNEGTSTWINFKEHEGNMNPGFSIQPSKGYLYSNAANTTLSFSGSLQPYIEAGYEVNLTKDGEGWNLVGNPFPFNAYVNKSYYVINGRTVEVYEGTDPVSTCTGIIVKATAANEKVTFRRTAFTDGAVNNGNLQMTVTQTVTTRGRNTLETLDNAIVSFNEGSELGKFYFGEQDANLYIPQGNEEYAIATSNAQGEMPVNFRANESGQYTLTVNPENVEMNYLHLIDNMTGADIDLLQTPSYTFNAKTYDYESRFRLVFAANNEDGSSTSSETFSFYSNGNLIISNEGNATLQVIDALGRILSNEGISGTVSKNIDAPAGVYVLRLINGENVKTQKIVVR